MLYRWFGPKAHDFLHVLGMCVLAAGLPFNKVLMSIGAIWGVSNLILEGDFKTYWSNLRSNHPALLLILLFLLGIIGLIWSANLGYGLDDIRKKLPLLALPLALVAKPLRKNEISIVLGVFVSSVFIISLVNFTTYFFFNHGEELNNVRSMSKYVSHIRFSMMIVAAALISFYFQRTFKKFGFLFIGLILWFLFYTYLSQVLTGILALIGILYGFLIYRLWPKKLFRISLLLTPFLVFILGFQAMIRQGHSNESITPYLLSKTDKGSLYTHDTSNRMVENGAFVNINICDEELRPAWNARSTFDYDGFDEQGQLITGTLYRYMTFLGLPKDGEHFNQLKDSAIHNIEKGYANPNYAKTGFLGRLADLKFQLENNNEPNGHSLLQRLEYWKTAQKIIQQNLIFGVGTGDVSDAFQKQYELDNSPLMEQFRLRAHNTYLSHWVSFGLLGIIVNLLFFYSFLRAMFERKEWLAFLLCFIFLFSFFIEDTLETQAGVSLFGLLISLFLDTKQKTIATKNS